MPPRDLETILKKTREIAEEIVAADADEVDREARWPERAIRALQAAGLGGLVAPADCGGNAQGLFALAQVCEILGQQCASTALCFGMHCVGSAVIAANPTPDQKARYLVPIAEGRHLTTLSLSEEGAGAHFFLPQTKLEASADGYRVTGAKTFVTNGGHADSYVVSVVAAEPDAPVGRFSCVMISADADGLEWGDAWSGLGMRGNASRRLAMCGVRAPRGDLLGREGDQIWYVFQVIAPYFLLAMAGAYIGVAGAALAEARNHLLKRRYAHSGATLAQASVLQHRMGCLWGMLERTRGLVYSAAQRFDAGREDAVTAVMAAKVEAADCAVTVANEAMTLLGGMAYRDGSRIHRLLRDARAAHVMAPTTDLLRLWIGRALLDQPILAD